MSFTNTCALFEPHCIGTIAECNIFTAFGSDAVGDLFFFLFIFVAFAKLGMDVTDL